MLRSNVLIPIATFVIGAICGAILVYSPSPTPDPDLAGIRVPVGVHVQYQENAATITIPASDNPTSVVLKKRPLGVNPDAPTFAEVAGQSEERLRSKKSAAPESINSKAMMRLAERQCSDKQGRAKDACAEQLISKCSRKAADEQTRCFLFP